jgi:orotidine-5'-phosphate decarboxylase
MEAYMPDGSCRPKPNSRRDVPDTMAERLIVALDVGSVAEAEKLVAALDGVVGFFKIGFRLQIAPGVDRLIDGLRDAGKKIFLDAKMYDIPETVESAVRAAAARGVDFVTVHGDADILKAAVRGRGDSHLKVFAVTVLTSLSDTALANMGYRLTARQLVQLRAATATGCGCDGIIASADDDPDSLRDLANGAGLLIATPGVRFAGSVADDQKRVATPRQAIENGADYLVVGRPIIASADPADAARKFIADMTEGQRLRTEKRAAPN